MVENLLGAGGSGSSSSSGGLLGLLGLSLQEGLLLLSALTLLEQLAVGDDALDDRLGGDRVLRVVNLDIDISVLGELVRILTVGVVQRGSVSVDNNVNLVNLLQNLVADTVRSANNDLIDVLLGRKECEVNRMLIFKINDTLHLEPKLQLGGSRLTRQAKTERTRSWRFMRG